MARQGGGVRLPRRPRAADVPAGRGELARLQLARLFRMGLQLHALPLARHAHCHAMADGVLHLHKSCVAAAELAATKSGAPVQWPVGSDCGRFRLIS